MTIIAISSTKGGPGKTTVSGCLADYWGKKMQVALLDTDPNQNLSNWYAKKEPGVFNNVFLLTSKDEDSLISDAKRLQQEHDIVLIDVAGVSSKSLLYAAGVADLVIIPAQPSEDDLVEAIKTRKMVANAETMLGKAIVNMILLTRVRSNTQVLSHSLQQIKDLNIPCFNTIIHDRTIFQKTRFSGSTPISFEKNGEAAAEIHLLATEIIQIIKKANNQKGI